MPKKYGGLFGPILRGMLHSAVRAILVQKGDKKAYRGGARIGPARKIVQGKDRGGHKKK